MVGDIVVGSKKQSSELCFFLAVVWLGSSFSCTNISFGLDGGREMVLFTDGGTCGGDGEHGEEIMEDRASMVGGDGNDHHYYRPICQE